MSTTDQAKLVSFRETIESVVNLANNQAPNPEDAARLLLTMSTGLDQQVALLDKAVSLALKLIETPPALVHAGPIPETISMDAATQLIQNAVRMALLAVGEVLVSNDFTRLEQIRNKGIMLPGLTDAVQEFTEWQQLHKDEPCANC